MNLIQLNSRLNNPYFLIGSDKNEIWLYAELKAAKVIPKNERAPLNISLVIDRSGSMQGDKLDYVKKAVDFVIQNLNSGDYLSIIQYDDHVDVLSHSAPVNNKAELTQKVNSIVAGGMTNLSGGMLQGYNEVKITRKDGYVNRVLLLSDGLANVGITEPAQLKEIARRQFQENRIGLSSFGVGADFNEELMMQLSEYGGANYYFIETPDQIPQIFAKELQGLLSVVAQNTNLEIEFPSEFLKVEKVYGYLYQQQGNKLSVNFNDVFSEEEKAIVIKFKIANPISLNSEFKVNLTYNDVVDLLDKVNVNQLLSLSPIKDSQRYQNSMDPETVENAVFFSSNDKFQEIMALIDRRDFSEAKNRLQNAVAYLKAYVEMFPASLRLANQLKQMEDYFNRIPQMEQIASDDFRMEQKSSKSMSYMMQKRKI